MAPEQWTGRAIDPRTDVYAMGATLFHLLAGRPPFTAADAGRLCAQHCNDPPPRLATFNPGVSEGVARVVERALSKQPEDRYIDAGAMLRDLEALLHGKPTDLAIHPRLPDCDPNRVLRLRVPLGAGIVTAAALAAGDQYRSARPGDRVCTGNVQEPLRAGPGRADLRRGPQGRHGRGRRGAPLRMGRAAADGGAARV